MATVALSPWWIPWAARPVARHFGIEWEQIDPQGWSAFVVRGIRVDTPGCEVTLDEARLPQPIPWLLYRMGKGDGQALQAGRLKVAILDTEPTTADDEPGRGIALLQDIRATLREYAPWIPPARLDRIEVLAADGSSIIQLEDLALEENRLTGHYPAQWHVPPARLALLLEADSLVLSGSTDDSGPALNLNLALTADAEGRSDIEGRLSADGSPVNVRAGFAPGTWVPDSMEAEARDWRVPDVLSTMADLPAGKVMADFDVNWSGSRYDLDLHLRSQDLFARYTKGESVADLRVSGDYDHLDVSSLQLQTAWLECRLSDPVRINIAEQRFEGRASLDLQADLDGQDWIPATGQVRAKASLQPEFRKGSVVEFELETENLSVREQVIKLARATGQLAWPVLTIDRLEVRVPETGHLLANGSYSFADQNLAGGGAFGVDPVLLQHSVPGLAEAGPVEGEFNFQGTPEQLQHQGRIRPVDLQLEGWHRITASAKWSGTGDSNLSLQLALESDQSSEAEAEVVLERTPGSGLVSIRVDDLVLVDPDRGVFSSDGPFTAAIDPAASPVLRNVRQFRINGEGSRLEMHFEADPFSLNIKGSQLEAGPLEGWLDRTVPSVVVNELDTEVQQLDPFLQGRFAVEVSEAFAGTEEVTFKARGSLDESGLRIESIESILGEDRLGEGSLFVPVRIHPLQAAEEGYYSPIPDSRLDGFLRADISGDLAAEFPEIPYLEEVPALRLNIETGGTPEEPEATISGNLANLGILQILDPRLDEYPFENIEFSLRLTRDQIELKRLRASLLEARINITGGLSTKSVEAYLEDPAADWLTLARQADLEAEFRNFRSEGFSEILPAYMRPTGLVDGELLIRKGLEISGELRVREFSLRPTLYSPNISGITAVLSVENSRLRIREAGATIGRSRFAMDGFVDLTDFREPAFQLSLTGDRISLFRTPDMILFGDVRLELKSPEDGEPASVSGEIRLMDSLMLMEFDPLAAQTAGRSLPKPPFFSIEQEPFDEWTLAVKIHGQDCLRFKSAYAKALLSVQLDLGGTLGNPVWVGNISSAEGTIDFPGLRTSLSRSELFVTRQRQDQLQLAISSIGQVASYVISMSVTGTTDDPHLSFASTPELSNSQILRLLATGSTNRSGVGSVGLYIGKGFIAPASDDSLWDRISIEIGRDVTESSKETIDLYYDLTDRWRLHGEYDKYDAHNLNLEWEIFSR